MNFEHAGVDLDDLALVLLLFDGHLHHVGGLGLHPFVFLHLLAELGLLVAKSGIAVPLSFLAGTPLGLVLLLAKLFCLLVSLLSTSIGIDGLDLFNGRTGKVVGEEVGVEGGGHEDEFELEAVLLSRPE